MTIKQLLEIAPATQELWVLNGRGCVFELNRHDPLTLAAFSDFVIETIEARDVDEFEITLKLAPVKEP